MVGRARRILPRLGGALAVLLAVATLAFAALQFIPGDPAEAALGGPGSQASAEALEAARAQFGLDRPVLVQYFDFLGRLLRGDLGVSYAQRIPVTEVLGAAIGPTLLLAAVALLMAWALALVSVIVASGHSRGWLPPVSTGGFNGIILPAVALAIPTAGFIAQVCRAGVDRARTAPFIETARARGETELGVRLRHVLRHGVVPGLTMPAWSLGSLLGGTAVIEIIFARPGLGRTLVNAVLVSDIPVVLGVTLFAAVAYVVVAFVTDLVVARVDPRTEARIDQAVPLV